MNLQLMEMRKAAGYSNRDDFARAHGIKLSTYKSYETGRIKLTLDKACELANIFGCTLDDLAGRKPPYDRQKAMLIGTMTSSQKPVRMQLPVLSVGSSPPRSPGGLRATWTIV